MNEFKENFFDIVTDTTEKYAANGAAELLVDVMRECAKRSGSSFSETVERFSNRPNYGSDGEAGGINVDHQTGVTYVNSNCDCTWMTLELLVAAAMDGGGRPDWWDAAWTTGQTDDEIADELQAEAFEDACVRQRFQSFGTGSPVVTIEYSFDENFVYEKCGRVTTKAQISADQFTLLDGLSFSDSLEAAKIFSDASHGISSAPIYFNA